MTIPAGDASGSRLLAVVLAGGTGERLGGVSKADLELAGRRLLDRALDATAAAGATSTVVVGEVVVDGVYGDDVRAADGRTGPRPGVQVVVEDPPRSGPAAGLVAGLGALGLLDTASARPDSNDPDSSNPDSDHPAADAMVLVLACDLADPLPGTRALVGALPLPAGVDGLCLGDADGRPQWLFGLYRASSLVRAAQVFGTAARRSVRALVAPLHLTTLDAMPGVPVDDIDTWDAHARWDAHLSGTTQAGPGTPPASG